jgi:small redox-active disulfide protein 2
MLSVKVLGPGCPNCQQVEAAAKRAAAALGVPVRVEKVTDRAEIGHYAILATPGLVINERVVAAGRIPGEAEIMTWLADALQPA